MRKQSTDIVIMVETAVLVGAALALSMIRLIRLPQGGSIGLDMLPIFLLAFRRGGKVGLVGGLLYGLLKLITDPFFVHPVQVLLDYPIPFAVLGIAGFFKKDILTGVTVGTISRYMVHVISGVVFFADYAQRGPCSFVLTALQRVVPLAGGGLGWGNPVPLEGKEDILNLANKA